MNDVFQNHVDVTMYWHSFSYPKKKKRQKKKRRKKGHKLYSQDV